MKAKLFKLKRGSVVTVIGGSGFLGNYVVRELASRGAVIKIVSRHPQKADELRTTGAVGQIGFISLDANDEKQLKKAIAGSDVVINLLGVLYSKGKQNFESMHVKVASSIASICARHNVKRLVHVSALGVERSSVTSKYARTKFAGEKAILQHFPSATIFRPSVIFGAEDNFTNMFNMLAKISPIVPLIGGGRTKFQPVFVGDLAKAIVAAIDAKPDVICGKTLEIGGPRVYTFREIIELVLAVHNRKRLLVSVPFAMARVQAFFLEFLPKPLLTRDQVELLRFDNVVFGKNGLELFDIKPVHMETLLPRYLT